MSDIALSDKSATATRTRATMPTNAEWQAAIAPYRAPIQKAAIAQLLNTVIPYLLSTATAYWMYVAYSFWAALPFIVLSGLLTVRAFIINHDCGHGSFTNDKKFNDIVGFWTGLLSFTPYWQWRHGHAIHHAHSGDVRHDGTGYVWIKTIRQYESGTWLQRVGYRLYRNPITIFLLGGVWLFLIEYRLPERGADARMKRDVYAVDAVWATVAVIISFTLGPSAFWAVQIPIAAIATSVGVWLFYFQHHYEEAYFGTETEWDYTRAALEGSSFLKLPKWLQFFSGNIGFHHIHHLSPKIPNYRLEEAHEGVSFFKSVKPLSLMDCVKAIPLSLVDSDTGRWTTFRKAAKARKARLAAEAKPAPTAVAPPKPAHAGT